MSPRRILPAVIAAAALGLSLMGAPPALAKPVVVTPGWSPLAPPSDAASFDAEFLGTLFSVSCGGVSATGWSADVADSPDGQWLAMLVTSAEVISACARNPGALVARQGEETLSVAPHRVDPAIGTGLAVASVDLPFIDWDYVPMPRVKQWVGIGARANDGSMLPLLERRIVSVGEDTFTVDEPIDATYLGAPVVDNMARVLGVVTEEGTIITGGPQFCDTLVQCDDASRVWWDITAPSGVRKLTATPGKRSVTFTWKRAASSGGAEAAYWYRTGQGGWVYTEKFSVKVKARKGERVTLNVVTVNLAGPGPELSVSAKAR